MTRSWRVPQDASVKILMRRASIEYNMYVSTSRFPSSFLIWSRQQVSIQVCWYYKFVISILVSLCCNGMQGWGDHKCFDPWWSMYIRLMCTLDVLVPSRYKKTTKMRCLHQDDLSLKELWAVPMWGHMYFMNDVFVQYQTHMSCETMTPWNDKTIRELKCRSLPIQQIVWGYHVSIRETVEILLPYTGRIDDLHLACLINKKSMHGITKPRLIWTVCEHRESVCVYPMEYEDRGSVPSYFNPTSRVQ